MDLQETLGYAKPVLTVTGLVILGLIETWRPIQRREWGRWGHAARNLAIALLNGVVLGLVFARSWEWASDWSGSHTWGLVNWLAWPWWVEAALVVLLFDAWMYVWHVANHRIHLLWRFHRMHHSDGWMDASSALRFHPGEIAISSGLRLALIPIFGMALWHLALYEVMLLPVILFHHSNIRLPRRLDDVLRTVIVTPWMHWQHHSQVRAEADSNYSSIFSLWDRMARSLRLRDSLDTLTIGLPHWDPGLWNTLRGMLLTPIRGPVHRP